MTPPLVRPRFELMLTDRPAEVMSRLRSRLRGCRRCTGMSLGDHAELFVAEHERRVWSPWLSVTAEPAATGSIVRARFSPHPGLWTLYVFVAFALAFAALVGGSWGYAQWVVERPPWALLSIPAGLLLAAALYGVSLLGQRLSQDQMVHLRAVLEELVAEQSPPPPG